MEFLLEMLAELFFALDGLTLIADVWAWMRGTENRRARSEARRRGERMPPRDGWNKAVIVLSLIAVALTAAIVWSLW